MPLACGDLGSTLEMGHQVNSTFGTGGNRVASFVAGYSHGADPVGKPGLETQEGQKHFHIHSLFRLKKASALNYLH